MAQRRIYLTSVLHARARTPGLAGPGNCWSIMARPRPQMGEGGHGRCWPLVPDPQAVTDARAAGNVAKLRGQIHFDDSRSALARERDVAELDFVGQLERSREPAAMVSHRDGYFDGPARHVDGQALAPCRHLHPDMTPGRLFARSNSGGLHEVHAGDVLMCSCAVDKAREGKCHRAWAGILLAANGWDVVLDGRPLDLKAPPDVLHGLWPRLDTPRLMAMVAA